MNEIELNNALKYAEMQLTLSTSESVIRIYRMIIKTLRAELSRQENAPLTWDELVSMIRKTVYIVDRTDDEKSGWAIVGKQYIKIGLEFITLCENLTFRRELKELYGQTWIAYRYEPKGEKACTQD